MLQVQLRLEQTCEKRIHKYHWGTPTFSYGPLWFDPMDEIKSVHMFHHQYDLYTKLTGQNAFLSCCC